MLSITVLILFNLYFYNANAIKQHVDEGFYTIESELEKNKVLDINEASIEPGVNLQIWDKNNTIAQIFYIREKENNFYEICAVCSGMALDVAGGQATHGQKVITWEPHGKDNQMWKFEHCYDDAFIIKSKLGNFCLDVKEGNINNGTKVILWEPNGQDNQIFKLKNVDIDNQVTFKGLPNEGCSCYLNTALQNLYHNPSFRKQVLDFEIPPNFKAKGNARCMLPAEYDNDLQKGYKSNLDITREEKLNACNAILYATNFYFKYLDGKITKSEFDENRNSMALLLGYDGNPRNSFIIQSLIEKACIHAIKPNSRPEKDYNSECFVKSNFEILNWLHHDDEFYNALMSLQDDDFYLEEHFKIKIIRNTIKTIFTMLENNTFQKSEVTDTLLESLGPNQTISGLKNSIIKHAKFITRSKNSKMLTKDSNIELGPQNIGTNLISRIDSSIALRRSRKESYPPKFRLPLQDNKFTVTFADRINSKNRENFIAEETIDLTNLTADSLTIFSNGQELNKTKFKLVSATIATGGHFYLYVNKDGVWHQLNDAEHNIVKWDDIKNDIETRCETLTYELIE